MNVMSHDWKYAAVHHCKHPSYKDMQVWTFAKDPIQLNTEGQNKMAAELNTWKNCQKCEIKN